MKVPPAVSVPVEDWVRPPLTVSVLPPAEISVPLLARLPSVVKLRPLATAKLPWLVASGVISLKTVFAPLRVTRAALVVIVPPPNESVEVAAVLVARTL